MRETARPADRRPMSEADLGRYFKALADDTRRAILGLLEVRERNVSEIVDHFSLTQPTISRHLQVLREARLVRSERRGQHIIYRLDSEMLAEGADGFFGRFRRCRQYDPQRRSNSLSLAAKLQAIEEGPGGRLRRFEP